MAARTFDNCSKTWNFIFEKSLFKLRVPLSKSIDRKVRHIIQALVSAFLVFFQYIPVSGPWLGPMIFPLAAYVFGFFWSLPESRGDQIYLLLFSPRLMFGRIVAIAGFAIFLIAFVQFWKERGTLITGGLYSAVRHPQYFGITVMTLGSSIMSLQFAFGGRPEPLTVWLIEVFGYVLLAGYEERHLSMEYEKEYQQYRQKVSFIFPVPRLNKIPEPLFSLAIALITAFLLTFI
jgi:protein-S-isoprenylcysteine O-methyltransferase Ste14